MAGQTPGHSMHSVCRVSCRKTKGVLCGQESKSLHPTRISQIIVSAMAQAMTQNEILRKVRDIDSLFGILTGDVIEVTEIWKQRGDELSHRLYVRTAFAAVEGIIQVMKSAAQLFDSLNNPHMLSPEEIVLLKEEDPQIGRGGEIEIKKKKISLLLNFEFALHTYARVRHLNVTLDKTGEGWQSLRHAIRIRDRLTHPHNLEDMSVGISELQVVEKAMRFFRDTTGLLLHHDRGE